MKTIVGMFDRWDQAQAAVNDLERAGWGRDRISIIANQDVRRDAGATDTESHGSHAGEGAGIGAAAGVLGGGAVGILASLGLLTIPGIGPLLAAGTLANTIASAVAGAAVGAGLGAVAGGLIGMGIPEEEAEIYEEGVRRGHTLVTVDAEDNDVDRVVDIMNAHDAADIDKKATEWRAAGWQSKHPARTTTGTTAMTGTSGATGMTGTSQRPAAPPVQPTTGTTRQETGTGERHIPVVNEELQVGKRQVERGGVRVYSRQRQEQVSEPVQLHEERVRVERRPADRAATPEDMQRMRDQTVEVRARSEEPVVQKTARVNEDVVVRKDAQDRTETVRDTVRRTDVSVEPIGGAGRPGQTAGFDAYDNDFRTYHQNAFAARGVSYDEAQPAYRTACRLASDDRYRGRDWTTVENDVRREYEASGNRTPWEKVKDSARYAYEKVTGSHRTTTG